METNTITRVSIWGGIGLLTIGTLYFLASQGNQSLRSDALSITPATCSLPSEIEAKTKEKESLVEAIKNTLKEKQKIETDISSKTELLTATTVSIKNLQEQILSDESLTNEEKKSSNLLAQKNKKIILG